MTWDASSEDSFDVKEPHVELELDACAAALAPTQHAVR